MESGAQDLRPEQTADYGDDMRKGVVCQAKPSTDGRVQHIKKPASPEALRQLRVLKYTTDTVQEEVVNTW